jgi:hypothetical protein
MIKITGLINDQELLLLEEEEKPCIRISMDLPWRI